jgi:hypothetical protein
MHALTPADEFVINRTVKPFPDLKEDYFLRFVVMAACHRLLQ